VSWTLPPRGGRRCERAHSLQMFDAVARFAFAKALRSLPGHGLEG
jgi:hypothetical protein